MEKAHEGSKDKRPLLISVTGSFVNVAQGYTYYVVTFPKPGKTFYLKAEHYENLLKVALKKHKVLNPKEDGNWIDTISFCCVRDKEYGDESLWRRTNWGNTIDQVFLSMVSLLVRRNPLRLCWLQGSSISLMYPVKGNQTLLGRLL